MYVCYYIRYQGNYEGNTDWSGVKAKTLVEVEIDGTLPEVKTKAIETSPVVLDPNSYWHDYGDICTYRPRSKDKLNLGNFIGIYSTCTVEASIEVRNNRKRNESVKIGLCEPCRQRYLEYKGIAEQRPKTEHTKG